MAVDDFAQNLRLLSSYVHSISEICRQTGINRQQYDRYLKGKSKPSLHMVRRICDFFGVDDHEVLLDHAQFQEIVRLKPPRIGGAHDPLHAFYDRLCRAPDQALKDPDKYVGYYHYYCRPSRNSEQIYRTLVRFYREGDLLLTKQIERYPRNDFNLPQILKHEGVVYCMSNRLVWAEREERAGASFWHSVFYSSDFNPVTYLSGLSLGITADSAHEIVCYRSLLEFLGKDTDVKAALQTCRAYDSESPEISDHVRACVSNDSIGRGEVFTPKN